MTEHMMKWTDMLTWKKGPAGTKFREKMPDHCQIDVEKASEISDTTIKVSFIGLKLKFQIE